MLTGRDWVVLIVVPETDFVGFVADSGWVALIMSVASWCSSRPGGLLVLRSMQAERRALGAAARQQALETRTQTFVDLAHQTTLDRSGLASTTESAAAACAAKRVAVWRLSADGRTLQCEDCFDSTAQDHTSGLALHHDELPNLFTALAKGAPIDTGEAGRDRRTSELFALYLSRSRSRASTSRRSSRADGCKACFGRRPAARRPVPGWPPSATRWRSCLALRFATADAGQAARVGDTSRTSCCSAGRGAAARTVSPSARHGSNAHCCCRTARSTRCATAPSTGPAVGVVKLPDWTTVAQRPSDSGERTAMDAIVHELRGAIERSGVS